MAFDLVVKNGMIVDGSGLPRYRGDIGVKDGKIAEIGRINGAATAETLDAEGHVVTPGFVDGHTHMDAQIFWDPIGTSSCFQGVTSVVMGNCGFTLAPCRESEADLVHPQSRARRGHQPRRHEGRHQVALGDLPRIPRRARQSLPKGINYAGYIGHCALRTYVMGERAFTDEATEDDLTTMVHHVREAIEAGAIGFSTTRSRQPQTSDDKPVASRLATWHEFETMVRAMGEPASVLRSPASRAGDRQRERREATTTGLSQARDRDAAGRSPSACSAGATSPGAWRAHASTSSTRTSRRAAACSPRCTAGR